MPDEYIIRSEDDAYELLKRISEDGVDLQGVQLKFDGWPKLQVHLVGEKYHQTITPTMMKGFIELQGAIYRSYALSKYGTPNIRHLTKEERDDLEVEVKVSDGSSNFEINLQDLFIKLIEMVGGKMEPIHIVTLVLGTGVMYFGTSALKSYLDHRKEVREKELKKEEQIAQIEALKFSSEQETERAKIMASLVNKTPHLENVEKSAHDVQTALVKAIATADSGELSGVELNNDVARELTTNARRKSEEVRLDGRFNIVRVDSSDPDEFKVKIRDTRTGDILDATVQDESLNQTNKPILQEAEWSRKPVDLKINARVLRGEIRSAVVLEVTKVEEEDD